MERFIKTSVNDVNEKHFAPIIKACRSILNKEIVLKDGKKIEANVGVLHSLYKGFCKNKVEEKVCEIIADSIIFYEKKFPTSGLVLVSMIASNFSIKENTPKRVSFEEAKSTVLELLSDFKTKALFRETMAITGADSKISVLRQPIDKPIIKLKTKPEVRIKIPEEFLGLDFKIPQEISDVYFFMINGAAANISELEFLFNESVESNSYFVLVSKSFSEEILSVLRLNFAARKLKVIPAIYGFDLDSINSLADLTAIAGGLPVSSDMGDVISGDHRDRYGYSEKVILKRNTMELFGETLGNPQRHILDLKKRIKESDSQDKRELLTKRLSSITGNSCEIILPRSEPFEVVAKELDVAFRVLKFCCAYLCNEVSILNGSKSIYFPSVSIEVATDRFSEINQIMQDTNRAVIKANVD